ncbi:MAG: helix-turn-helix domain-containing protein [Spongiibacteraceae bacterium]
MSKILDLSSLSLLASVTASCGADLNAVVSELDMQFAADGAGIGKLSLSDISGLFGALEASAQRKHFPFAFAEVFNFDGQPEVSAFLVSAQRLRDLGPLLDWIPELIHPAIHFDTLDEGRWAHTIIHIDDETGEYRDMPAFVELVAAVVVRLCRSAFADACRFNTVQFGHSPRAAQQSYDDFFGCPVSFGHTETRIIQDGRVLDTPLPGSLPAAHAQAEQSIRLKLIGDGVAPPLILQVSDLLRQRPELLCEGIEPLASILRMKPRTLQRQLRAQGRSYSEILARTRHNLACEMLRDGTLDIDSIAFKLGFSERRSFTQAFRKWQGQTPSGYRREAST